MDLAAWWAQFVTACLGLVVNNFGGEIGISLKMCVVAWRLSHHLRQLSGEPVNNSAWVMVKSLAVQQLGGKQRW